MAIEIAIAAAAKRCSDAGFRIMEFQASAERVWRLLTDFDRFPEWNPFLRRAEVPLFSRMLDKDTKRGFLEMNNALKMRAERAAEDLRRKPANDPAR